MIEYFINSLSDAKEKILSYKFELDLIDNADIVNRYNKCLKLDVVRSYDQILYLVAMQISFLDRFGKSPIYLKKCIVGLTFPIMLNEENYKELHLESSEEIIRISINHPAFHHPHASIDQKVEILAKDPYRFYLDTKAWINRSNKRIILLEELMDLALKEEKYELCIRIEEVKEVLSKIYNE